MTTVSESRQPSASAVTVGPTWRRMPDGRFDLPERTLAWQVIPWCWEFLKQPDGPEADDPWQFTDEQARFLAWWYAVDAKGRFVFRRGVLRRMKGWGKDPFGAVLCAVEFVGPCRFDGWDASGDPVARTHPAAWVQTAAVSKDQTRNTMTLFPGLFTSAALTEYSIDLGKEIIYAHRGRARIEAVTSSPRALEGGRASFTLPNETQHWLRNNEGHEMARVIRRNLGKSRDGQARSLALTNAHEPGEDSVGEHDWDGWLKIAEGKSKASGFLYDSLEAPYSTEMADRPSLRNGLLAARGDSHWVDVDRIADEVYDPTTSPSESRRFYLNQIVAAEDSWVSPAEWDGCAVQAKLADGDEVTLGFDGSRAADATALVAFRLADECLFPLGVWESTGDDWEVDRELVDVAVQTAFSRFKVAAFYADVALWESYVDRWSVEYRNRLRLRASPKSAVGWDMRTRRRESTIAAEAMHASVVDRTLRHDGDPVLRRHALNARRRPGPHGVSFGKEHRESSRKVDALAAAMVARQAGMDVLGKFGRRGRKVVVL